MDTLTIPDVTTSELAMIDEMELDYGAPVDAELIDTGCGANGSRVVDLFSVDAFVGSREYGPPAMFAIYPFVEKRIPRMTPSGIVGNSAHTYGYHRCRDVLPSHDYSVTMGDDQSGDGHAASALDASYPPDLMRLITARMIRAIRDEDPRAHVLREVFGTLNGRNVTGYSSHKLSTGAPGPVTADSSHLWHVHLSVHRRWCNDHDAMQGVAELICGIAWSDSALNKDNDMPDVKDIWTGGDSDVIPAPDRETNKDNPTWRPGSYLKTILDTLDAQGKAIASLTAAVSKLSK